MRIHSVVESSTVNGPGCRMVVWFQGCQGMSCRAACWNSATHDPAGGREVSVREMVDTISRSIIASAESGDPIEGVTFSGGEPMQQSASLASLIKMLGMRHPWLSIGLYSGYSEGELETGRFTFENPAHLPPSDNEWRGKIWREIKSRLDFAVLGRFNPGLPCDEPLRTSRNQVLKLYSARYTIDDFAPQRVEVTTDETGFVQITGFAVNGFPG